MRSIRKGHAMWSGEKLKVSYAMIDRCMKLTVHLTNAQIKHAWEQEAYLELRDRWNEVELLLRLA